MIEANFDMSKKQIQLSENRRLKRKLIPAPYVAYFIGIYSVYSFCCNWWSEMRCLRRILGNLMSGCCRVAGCRISRRSYSVCRQSVSIWGIYSGYRRFESNRKFRRREFQCSGSDDDVLFGCSCRRFEGNREIWSIIDEL